MIQLDIDGLKALVWRYGSREAIIQPITWEKIICKSVNGEHISGDKYMADVVQNTNGLSVKTIKAEYRKGDVETRSFIQCRCPLDNDQNIGKGVIETLVKKRQESFEKFDIDKMFDVIIVHNRFGNNYSVRVFIEEQERYEDLNLFWEGSCAYINPNKTKKSWRRNWKLMRNEGNSGSYQTCLHIKKVLNLKDCIANFSVECYDDYDISIEEAKKLYAKALQK